MDKIGKKRFKEPSAYYRIFLFYAIVVVALIWAFIYFVFFLTEADIYEMFAEQKIFGTNRGRYARALQSHIVREYGKLGLLILLSICLSSINIYFCSQIAEYRRYKKKCRLYHEGLIENFYDIYDDHVSYLLPWRIVKMLFSRKEKTLKKKLPNKRTMKKQIRESEKYFEQKNKR